MKKILVMLLTCSLLLPLGGCGSKPQDSDFYTFKRTSADGFDRIYVGESQDDLELASPIHIGNEGVGYKVETADGKKISSAIQVRGHTYVTWIGHLGLDDPMANVLPAFAGIAGVTTVTDTPSQIVLQKTIGGARYTATFNAYDDGTIKNITLTNIDTCTHPYE